MHWDLGYNFEHSTIAHLVSMSTIAMVVESVHYRGDLLRFHGRNIRTELTRAALWAATSPLGIEIDPVKLVRVGGRTGTANGALKFLHA